VRAFFTPFLNAAQCYIFQPGIEQCKVVTDGKMWFLDEVRWTGPLSYARGRFILDEASGSFGGWFVNWPSGSEPPDPP